MKKLGNKFKFVVGIFFAVFFMFIAFRNVNFQLLVTALHGINYFYLLLVFVALFLNAYLRAARWRLLLAPIKDIDTGSLLTSLLLGHAGNIIFPAYLGEIVRVYILGKKRQISSSSALATIVTERIIDVFFLLILMFYCIFNVAFPAWIKNSGYLMLALFFMLIAVILILNKNRQTTISKTGALIKFLPEKLQNRALQMLLSFLKGFVTLKNKRHYLLTFILSILIFLTHLLSFVFGFYAFGLNLPWIAPFVLLVFTTISVAFPITPGYVGSYHLLCQFALSLFAIAKSIGLGYALVIHGLNTIPFLLIGLGLAWKEGISLMKISATQTAESQVDNDLK